MLSLDKIFLRSVVTEKLFLSLGGLLFVIASLCYVYVNMKENFQLVEVIVKIAPIITYLCTFLCFGSVLWKIRHSIGEIWSSITENTDFFNIFHIALKLVSLELNHSDIFVWGFSQQMKNEPILYHLCTHCSYLDIYISQKIRLCKGDFEGKFQFNLQAKLLNVLV